MSLGISRPEFEKLVDAALRSLPPYFRRKLAVVGAGLLGYGVVR